MITFISIDKENRNATFSVNGVEVTRGIPDSFEGSIDGYLQALADGLSIEFHEEEQKSVDDVSIDAGTQLA